MNCPNPGCRRGSCEKDDPRNPCGLKEALQAEHVCQITFEDRYCFVPVPTDKAPYKFGDPKTPWFSIDGVSLICKECLHPGMLRVDTSRSHDEEGDIIVCPRCHRIVEISMRTAKHAHV